MALVGGPAASAQEDDAARFTLEPSGDGFVRLDRRTGVMSYCVVKAERLVCRLAADERKAYETEIARLQERLEEGAADADRPRSDRLPPSPDAEEREFEKAMEYAERALRRFYDMMQRLRSEWDERRQPY
ncbi:MAG: hypothetical protein BroJett030_16410 [Alphaproteobacteria bacterium]|nr:MAG: hypothetical protein BroJett030_16410 [Alphaproteobacteria bacterium]